MHIITGIYRHRKILVPKGLEVRPTSSKLRESLFNICQNFIGGTRFLDIFAGSGAMGLEALSRGAASATFIENNREAILCIKENIDAFEVGSQTKVLAGDAFAQLKKLTLQEQKFDIIFADPPYHKGSEESFGQQILEMVDNSSLLNNEGVLFLEESKTAPLQQLTLNTLALKSQRRMGRSTLLEYIKR
jgi:16S rRNA (guanine966-N2)-methyltransferase